MFHRVSILKGYSLAATDGEIGDVRDLYFDDCEWKVRYLALNTGAWLLGRDVLIAPEALGRIDEEEQSIAVNLTREKIERAPALDTARPVSRQHAMDYHGYYGWPLYWGGSAALGIYPAPGVRIAQRRRGYRL